MSRARSRSGCRAAPQPLAAPVAAATQQLALNVAQRALASPRVQDLVSTAISGAQQRLVRLLEDEGEFVSSTGGEVTLEYGKVLADLAARLGVDPATISKIQGIVKEYSTDLRQGLTTAQSEIKSARQALSQVQQGELSSEQRQNLQALNKRAAELQGKLASLEAKIKGAQGSVPAPLQGRLSKLESRLAELDGGLGALEQRTAAVLADPSAGERRGPRRRARLARDTGHARCSTARWSRPPASSCC